MNPNETNIGGMSREIKQPQLHPQYRKQPKRKNKEPKGWVAFAAFVGCIFLIGFISIIWGLAYMVTPNPEPVIKDSIEYTHVKMGHDTLPIKGRDWYGNYKILEKSHVSPTYMKIHGIVKKPSKKK